MANAERTLSRERQAAEATARRRHLSVTVGLTVLTSVVYAGVALMTAGRLPAVMATHFDLTGRPDGFMATTAALFVQGLFVLGVPLALLAVFSAGQWWRGELARSMSATIAGLSASLTTLFVTLTLAHVGVENADEVTLRAATALLALAAGVVVALLTALILPKPLPRLPAPPVTPMAIAPTDRVSWFGKAHTGPTALAAIGLGIVVIVAAALATGVVWLWLLVVLLVILILGITSFDLNVDARGVAWRAALGLPRGRVKLSEITDVSVIEVNPGDFGGYGVRVVPGRLGLITRSGSALLVAHGKRELVVTVDDAFTAASVLEGLRGRGPTGPVTVQ